MSHLIGEGRRTPVTVPCESVSIEGNRCEMQQLHVGCHEAFVGGDCRRWWDFVAETPGERPLRRVVAVFAFEEDRPGAPGSGVSEAAQQRTVYALTDADIIREVELEEQMGCLPPPTTYYLVKHDGKLRELAR